MTHKQENIALGIYWYVVTALGAIGGCSLIVHGGVFNIIIGTLLSVISVPLAIVFTLCEIINKGHFFMNVINHVTHNDEIVDHYENVCSKVECPYDEYSEEEEES